MWPTEPVKFAGEMFAKFRRNVEQNSPNFRSSFAAMVNDFWLNCEPILVEFWWFFAQVLILLDFGDVNMILGWWSNCDVLRHRPYWLIYSSIAAIGRLQWIRSMSLVVTSFHLKNQNWTHFTCDNENIHKFWSLNQNFD